MCRAPLLVALSGLSLAVAILESTQLNALVELFNATQGAFWTAPIVGWVNVSAGFTVTTDPCEAPVWTGVTCGCNKTCVLYVFYCVFVVGALT